MAINSFYNIIKYTSALSVLIPLVTCLINLKALNNLVLRALLLYLIIASIAEAMGFYLMKNNLQTYTVQNSFTLLEFVLILLIYYLTFQEKKIRILIALFCAAFILFFVYLHLFRNGLNKQDNILNTIEAAFFMILAYFYFYKVIQELNISNLTDYYFTWINAAFLIYFSAGFVMFLFNEYIENFYIKQFYLVYCLYLFASIAYNIILSVGIWKIKDNS